MRLAEAGIEQYEISNFARPGMESHHNLKYWKRQPYMGFGVDAHSMLLAASSEASKTAISALRFSAPGTLEQFLAGGQPAITKVSGREALEEEFFADQFLQIAAIPYLGTGKLDLRRLRELALEMSHRT